MITICLLDFASGDCTVTTPENGSQVLRAEEAERLALSFPDDTKLVLTNIADAGHHETTVGAVRDKQAWLWNLAVWQPMLAGRS